MSATLCGNVNVNLTAILSFPPSLGVQCHHCRMILCRFTFSLTLSHVSLFVALSIWAPLNANNKCRATCRALVSGRARPLLWRRVALVVLKPAGESLLKRDSQCHGRLPASKRALRLSVASVSKSEHYRYSDHSSGACSISAMVW